MTERRSASFLPREHGFWVMLAAVLVAAVARRPEALTVWLAALIMLVAAAVGGGLIRRKVRHNGAAQLASAAALAMAGAPVDHVAGIPPGAIAATVGAWATIFVACALVVRATFSRARGHDARARTTTFLSVLIPAIVASAYAVAGAIPHAAATGAAALGCALVALSGPTVKQLKPVGWALASVSAVAALALSLPL